MKQIPKYLAIIVITALAASCERWNATESVGIYTSRPWETEPQLWEEYKANLRDYKSRKHNIVYIRFDNSPENASSEKAYMRCLPDSLDIVSLTNAENFSAFDAEDMAWMKSVGTKVLYQVDFAGRTDELLNETKLTTYLEQAITTVRENGLDGWSFTGTPKAGDTQIETISSKIVEKLATVKAKDQILVFEGIPNFVVKDDLDKIDLFVLGTETMENSYNLRNAILDAEEYGVPKEKMLLASSSKGVFYNTSNAEIPVIEAMADNTILFGPMAGLALYDMESDYYHYEGNWLTIRSVIERLNPSR